jgi:pimeloyl-ACP methyl ester carboxylesterase
MPPVAVLIPLAERLARKRLHSRGYASRFFETKAGKMHAFDAPGRGTLPPIVIVHGLVSSAIAFAPIMERMRPYVKRVIGLELPGHGFSEMPAMTLTPELAFEAATEALDQITGDPFVLVGNSLGGAVTLHYAVERPKRPAAIALFSPAGAQGSDADLEDVTKAFGATTRKEARELLRRIYHHQRWFLPLIAVEFPSLLAKKSVRDLLGTVTHEDSITPEELATLTMPILFV